MMRQSIHRDLNLTRHGLVLVPYLGTVNFGDDGRTLVSYPSAEAEYNHLRKHCPQDADAMFRFQADLTRYAQLIRKTLLRTPPDPTSFKPRDIRELLFLAKTFGALGEKEIYEYVRFFTMSAISNAIAGAAVQEHGGEIRTNAGVHQILVKNGKAVGLGPDRGTPRAALDVKLYPVLSTGAG